MLAIASLGINTGFAPWQWIGFWVCLSFLITVVWLGIQAETCVRIVPCFQKPLDWVETGYDGRAVAKNCLRLDEIAVREGVPTLSSYGFACIADKGTAEWCWAKDGLRSILGILRGVKERPGDVEFSDRVLSDLEAISRALLLAEAHEVRFCLRLG